MSDFKKGDRVQVAATVLRDGPDSAGDIRLKVVDGWIFYAPASAVTKLPPLEPPIRSSAIFRGHFVTLAYERHADDGLWHSAGDDPLEWSTLIETWGEPVVVVEPEPKGDES